MPVADRIEESLLEITKNRVELGTIIIQMGFYHSYNKLSEIGYSHKVNFVDPVTEIYTNKIESM